MKTFHLCLLFALCAFGALAAFSQVPCNVSLLSAVDAPTFIWSTGGNASWCGQTADSHDGQDAARSGIITHNQETHLTTRIIGPGNLSFWWRASSESGFDILRLSVDGSEIDRISGETGWRFRALPLTSGSHLVEWRYIKDSTESRGADAGWVDEVSLACSYEVSPNFVSFPPTGGNRTLNVSAPPGCHWTAEVIFADNWVELVGEAGNGNGVVTVSVGETDSCFSRQATVQIRGDTGGSTSMSLRQDGKLAQYTISPPSAFFTAGGGNPTGRGHSSQPETGSAVLTAEAPCAWTAESQAPWITLTSPSSGSGSASMTYRITGNPICEERVGILVIAGRTFTVTQDARTQPGAIYIDCTRPANGADGSPDRPFPLIVPAVEAACDGDTLRLLPCNYPETFSLTKPLRLEAPGGTVNIGRP